MAKAWPVTGLQPKEAARANLPPIFSVRIAELWSWAEHLPFPDRRRELHHMRISAKRLRYCFEFFAACFGPGFGGRLRTFKQLQDYLGEIHDCDVWVDYLRRQLRDAFRELDRRRKGLDRHAGADPALLDEAAGLASEMGHGPAQGLLMLIGDVVERRQRLYEELLVFWRGLEEDDFHGQLVAAVSRAARERGAEQ
jgi:hypothetical protein